MAYALERSAGDESGIVPYLRHDGESAESDRENGSNKNDQASHRNGNTHQSDGRPVARQNQHRGTGELQGDIHNRTTGHSFTTSRVWDDEESVMSEYYPVNDYCPAMPGLIMAAVVIVHVFLAQFAVGGGFLLCCLQWLAMTGRNEHARLFVSGYFKVLVLVSFVLGATTGVGNWSTSIQISAPTIGEMVPQFLWLWTTEWTFFCLEFAVGCCFNRYHDLSA